MLEYAVLYLSFLLFGFCPYGKYSPTLTTTMIKVEQPLFLFAISVTGIRCSYYQYVLISNTMISGT